MLHREWPPSRRWRGSRARDGHRTALPCCRRRRARSGASDLYRVQEDANLQLNIRQAGPLGKGFGVPIDYVLPIQDISSIDPLIKYIPHNGVLYILLRMGILGGIAFWSLLGAALISACRLAKMRDRELAVVGATTAAVVIAYAFEGYTDQGFFYYRVLRFCTIRTSYMRWSQAWMLLAVSTLLCESGGVEMSADAQFTVAGRRR